MPNWCYNSLTITGDKKELKKFKKFVFTKNYYKDDEEKDLDFDFSKIIAYPKRFAEADELCYKLRKEGVAWDKIPKDGFNSGGYEWCIKNWGTKWNARVTNFIEDKDGTLVYDFDTAWSPAIPVITEASKMFPTLHFELHYTEESMAFKGDTTFDNGEVDDDCRDVKVLHCPDEDCGDCWDEDEDTECPSCGKTGIKN